jgi:glyceraldehyde-3-phosphate dehydrogenase/erythrose-4-phosphate dehydrogenase
MNPAFEDKGGQLYGSAENHTVTYRIFTSNSPHPVSEISYGASSKTEHGDQMHASNSSCKTN